MSSCSRVGKRMHFTSAVMVSVSSIFSSVWITLADSWQQTPAWRHIVQMTRDGNPWAFVVPVLNVLAIANIPRAIYLNRPRYAFVSTCCTIAAFVFLFSVALFPDLVTSDPDPQHSPTIFNAASSRKTLGIMLIIIIIIIAAVGMPCVIVYTANIYRKFSGKVELTEHSY